MMSGWMADYIWGLLIGVLYASILLFSIPLYLIWFVMKMEWSVLNSFPFKVWPLTVRLADTIQSWRASSDPALVLGPFLKSKLNSKPIFQPPMASIQRRYCLNKEQHTKEVNKRRADFPVCPWYISSFVFHQTGIFLPNWPTGGSSSIQSGWLAGEPSWHKV